jgi:hypothetical protein
MEEMFRLSSGGIHTGGTAFEISDAPFIEGYFFIFGFI